MLYHNSNTFFKVIVYQIFLTIFGLALNKSIEFLLLVINYSFSSLGNIYSKHDRSVLLESVPSVYKPHIFQYQ